MIVWKHIIIFERKTAPNWEPFLCLNLGSHYACLCSILHILSIKCDLLCLEVLSFKYRKMSKNYIFRELEEW